MDCRPVAGQLQQVSSCARCGGRATWVRSVQSVPSTHALIPLNVGDIHWMLLDADPVSCACDIADRRPSLTARVDAGGRLPALMRETLGYLTGQL